MSEGFSEKLSKSIRNSVISPAASLLKVALRSRRPSPAYRGVRERPVIVMGNGPSLRSFIEAGEEIRRGFDLLSVNFAANAPEFFNLRPDIYILADPHFFNGITKDANVARLWENLRNVNWPMTLWLPADKRGITSALRMNLPQNIKVKWYNLTPAEGKGAIVRAIINRGLGMPRPRNVLIPAIITAIREGYKRIFLVGADHTWSQSLWVDDKNRVVSVQPHFYKDNEKEQERVASEYAGYHLHDILKSLTIAFKSYFNIADFADYKGVQIFNATPGSFIDAFPRCDYAQMKQLSKM